MPHKGGYALRALNTNPYVLTLPTNFYNVYRYIVFKRCAVIHRAEYAVIRARSTVHSDIALVVSTTKSCHRPHYETCALD
jgi:hypothetical protein